MKKKAQKHSNLNFDTVSLIYQTKKQFWSISNRGVKKRISKIFFDFLLSQKKLISYEDSKIFKKGVPFNVLPTEIEVIFNDVKQFIKILNPISVRYNFMDLFCGAGGLSEGLINAGLTPILCLDNNKDACLTLKKNHSQVKVVNDKIQNFDFSEYQNKVDILVGGSPCQSFSYAGLGKGLKDSNGRALLEFIQIIFFLKPKIFVLENVKGLLSHNQGKTLEYIVNLFSKENLYHIEFDLINMEDYGIPQKRQRLFILGSLKSINLTNLFPIPKLYPKQVLRDVLMNVPDSKGARYSKVKEELFQKIPEGGCWINLLLEDQKNYLGKMFHSGGGKRGILRRLSMSEPSLTLLCSPSQKQTERCHPFEERPLTIREYARIQTFKDDYYFYGSLASQYRQIGNAIPVLFSYQLGIHLSSKLSFSDT